MTDLIDVARDRLQSVKLDPVDYGAADLVDEAIVTAGVPNKVETDLDRSARVWAEPGRVRQILVNLITNASRYGRSRILITEARVGTQVVFTVHDDGSGVPAKFQSDIWGRFERGQHKHDASVPGSGIGLSVAKDLVTAHGGTIGYRASELLGGACFEFTIPVPEQDLEALTESQVARVG